jgi:hypothetical protein
VAVAAVAVQLTRSGVDVLAVLVAGFLLLVLERTAGDWIADTVGEAPVAVLFGGIAVLGLAYVQTPSGRSYASRLFSAAEARGYRTAYFTVGATPTARNVAGGSPRAATRPSAAPVTGATSPAGKAGQALTAPVASRGEETGGSRVPRLGRLRITPEVSVTDREVALTVDATGGAEEIPDVEFSVDGRSVGRSPFVNGVATLRWKTRVPGRYTVRVRFAHGLIGSGTSAFLNVLPGGS